MKKLSILLVSLTVLVGCSTQDQIQKTIEKNPDLVFKAIEKNPEKFIQVFQKALEESKKSYHAKKKEEERKTLAGYFINPLKPMIRDDETFRGNKNAPITIVEFFDFQCPYCGKGSQTVDKLRERYGEKVKVVYRHLPLNFHPQAMISAMYYEAIRLQSEIKAFKFHDLVFENQRQLSRGEKFLKKMAREVGADLKAIAKDLKSKKIRARIEEDMSEASKLGFNGTPGYILNGIPLKGALPKEQFVQIIAELEKRNLVKL